MRTLLLWIALGGFAAIVAVVYRAYESVGMQLAWERLLAFCGH
jgi:hypothetical protein